MSWFKRNKKPKAPTVQEASQDLADRIEKLRKKEEYLEKQEEIQLQEAKKYLKAGNRAKAATCLKRKKMLEKQHQQVTGMLFNLEASQLQVQNVGTNKMAFDGLSNANAAMKAQFDGMDIDKYQEKLDEIQDTNQQIDELTGIMAAPMFNGPDDDEIDADLDDLLNEQADLGPQATITPGQAQTATNDEDELEGLMAGYS